MIMRAISGINSQFSDLVPLLKQMLQTDLTKRIKIDDIISDAQSLLGQNLTDPNPYDILEVTPLTPVLTVPVSQ